MTRWIDLEGLANARDLGGLPLADGSGETVGGRVIRADNLQTLTKHDVRRLVDELQLKSVVDLRTTEELTLEGPGPLTQEPLVAHHHLSLMPESGEHTDVQGDMVLPWMSEEGRERDRRAREAAVDGTPAPTTYYLGYLDDRPESIVGALRVLAQTTDGASIVHCAAGKDRTGTISALALELAGVDRDAIIDDYVLTGERMPQVVSRLLASDTYREDIDGRPLDSFMPRQATIKRMLEILDERHGGVAGWLTEHGFGPDELAALRRSLRGS